MTDTSPPHPAAREFDFWLGEWDVTWGEGQCGSNRIEAILNSRVILENFNGQPAIPFRGMSVSVYDFKREQWRQTWVDDTGNYWAFTGGFHAGRMTLQTDDMVEGRPVKLRMMFYNIAADELDWDWEKSEDSGETWTLLWHIHYRRKGASS
ncbi:MAG: DUF1579 family protein [Anaerolineales bacterium]